MTEKYVSDKLKDIIKFIQNDSGIKYTQNVPCASNMDRCRILNNSTNKLNNIINKRLNKNG